MRICHLSWEYPPLVYGGLGRHVHALAEAQAAAGHDVVVITQHADGMPDDSVVGGVRIIRPLRDAPDVPLDAAHLLGWIAGFNSAVLRAGMRLLEEWVPDVVHGHDWLVAYAAVGLRDAVALRNVETQSKPSVPLVLTIHATEAGRHQGWVHSQLSKSIHGIETWVTAQAALVIACSEYMRWETTTLFGVPADRLAVIPNGTDPDAWTVTKAQRDAIRVKYPQPYVLYTGRLQWEKGVQTLVDAFARMRSTAATLLIAGRGSYDEQIRKQVAKRRLGKLVEYPGWLPEDELHALVASADAVVVPSLYEPFGIVALEAASVAAPLVVARTGGLAEIVIDGVTGRTFEPGDDADLARVLTEVLADPAKAQAMAKAGRQRVIDAFGWPAIAAQTVDAYAQAITTPSPARPDAPMPYAGDTNLLHPERDIDPGPFTRKP